MRTTALLLLLVTASITFAKGPASTGKDVTGVPGPADDPLAAWRISLTVRPLTTQPGRHTIHTYYLTCPESPDSGGSRVLFYTSTVPSGEHGDLVVLDRATGKETVIARDIHTEDAHRAACASWTCNGQRVAYHDVKNDRWSVHIVDLATGKDMIAATDHQVCFGNPTGDLVPVYGPHWKPGDHRGLEFLNARTGEVKQVLPITVVEQKYGDWLATEFAGKPTSVFFPNISPDGTRVFWKMAAPGTSEDYKSKAASHRQGLVVYDLKNQQFLFQRNTWGHPGWSADSKKIIEVGNIYFDLEKHGEMVRMPDLPRLGGCHPAFSPDGKLFVQDGPLGPLEKTKGEWGVIVCDVRGGQYVVLKRFDNSKGAKTWRKNHPHPIFSPDGKRIYFNVNEGDWTQLHVAELAPAPGSRAGQ